MDALAVSAVSGMTQQPRLRQALLFAAAFGGFQGLMPLLGYYAGNWLAVAACLWAPWLGCGLLVAVGGKMLLDSLHGQAQAIIQLTLRLVLLQAVATSIDALAVGVTFAFLEVAIVPAASVIGVTTFCLSLAGVAVGNFFGARYKRRAELSGGVILILLGGKILLEHLGVF